VTEPDQLVVVADVARVLADRIRVSDRREGLNPGRQGDNASATR